MTVVTSYLKVFIRYPSSCSMDYCYHESKAHRLETRLHNTQKTCKGPQKPLMVFERNQVVSQNAGEWPGK